jgi:N-acetylmuramate 1-kinase
MTAESQSEAILNWALPKLQGKNPGEISVSPVAGDASGRAYFRAEGVQPSRILVHSPPATEKNDAFLGIRNILQAAGVRVPAIIAADLEHGYMLLEDLGDRLLLPALNDDSVDALYERAFGVLLQISQVDLQVFSSGEKTFACYDEALLSEELGRFSQWFVGGLLEYSLSDEEKAVIGNLSGMLVSSALEQPQAFVHRDFHSRNLMLVEDDELAVIDFQDAVWGPVTYDLVSLLRDCYVKWPAEKVEAWALQYHSMLLAQAGPEIAQEIGDEAQFIRWFDLMGLQRHIKVLGTFARLYLRDGKTAYLGDLPMVLEYVNEMLGKYASESEACREFHRWFEDALNPLIVQQIEKQGWSASS